MEAKPDKTAGGEDPSMEEILQSIRKIIAEDDDAPKAALPTGEPENVRGSDVLELTEMVQGDGSIVSLKDKPPEPAPAAPAPTDILGSIDQALAPAPPEPAAPPAKPAEPPAAAKPEAPTQPQDVLDSLLSAQAAAAAAAAFKKMDIPEEPLMKTTPSPAFRSGATVEDMVEALLRPMMKQWLDENLPVIVERVVEREVHKLSRR